MSKLVRLRPYNPAEGCLLQRFGFKGRRFFGTRGWYRVSDTVAAQLAKVRQPPAPGSKSKALPPLAFDVADDKRGASKIERADTPEPEKASFEQPHEVKFDDDAPEVEVDADLTTEDLGTTKRAPKARASTRGSSRGSRRRSSSSR